jgi:hypothetical protein
MAEAAMAEHRIRVTPQLAKSITPNNPVQHADLNEAARAADATREANGAVCGERLK